MGKKANSNNWRFIGGFADPDDDSYEAAAQRELAEECGLTKTTSMVYESSRRVNDWRYRSEEDKIITMLFSCDYINGAPAAQDDIVGLKWFPLNMVLDMIANGNIDAEHADMLEALINKYLKLA